MTDVTVAYGTAKTATQSITPDEVFNTIILLAGGASDTSLTLGTLTNPKIIMVFGGADVSFKLGSDGTDAIGADPFAVVADDGNGLSETIILLSNSGAGEITVYVYAEE